MATTNKSLEQPLNASLAWDVPLNANFGYIDESLGKVLGIAVGGVVSSPQTLTVAQYRCAALNFTGILGLNLEYRIPSGVNGFWIIANNTTGSFTLSIGSAGLGSTVTIPQGERRFIYCDGTNVLVANTYGAAGRVLFNGSSNVSSDSLFTYGSSLLTVPRISLDAGTATDPSIVSQDYASTGLYFPADKVIGLTMNGTVRARFNEFGVLGVGSTVDYGDAGEFLKSNGDAAEMSWAKVGMTYLGTAASSGASTITVSGLTLTGYKFLKIVFRALSHSAGTDRNFTILGNNISAAVAASITISGIADIDLDRGVLSVSSGTNGGGGSAYSTAFASSYTTASTSVAIGLSASGGFDNGDVFVYGVA